MWEKFKHCYKIKFQIFHANAGFNVENVKFGKGLDLTVWDVGGQEKIRRLWKHYFHNLQGWSDHWLV